MNLEITKKWYKTKILLYELRMREFKILLSDIITNRIK